MKLALKQLRNELVKLFARKRTYMGFVVMLLTEIAIVLLLHLPKAQRQMEKLFEDKGCSFGEFFSGLTIAFIVLSVSASFLIPLFLTLVGGDIVAKESEMGTLRMTLSRPISRARLLILKWLSVLVYTFALILFVAATGLIAGGLFRGFSGHLFVFHPEEAIVAFFSGRTALVRYMLGAGLLCWCASTVTTLALFFSCLNIKPAAATVFTLSLIFADTIISHIPYFKPYKPWFISSHLASWTHAMRAVIPWHEVASSFLYLTAVTGTCLIAGMLAFYSRDFK